MHAVRAVVSSMVLALSACGPQVGDDAGGGGGSDSGGSGGTGTGTQGASSSAGSSGAEGTTGGSITVGSGEDGATHGCVDDGSDDGVKLDVGPPDPACDIFLQDCEAGSKCVPDDFWTRVCVPIVDDPIADGEPCTPATGTDPCGPGSWCGLVDHGTVDEPGSGMGTCLPQCQGTAADPQCPADTICVIDDEFVVAFCQAPCDPFAADPCGAQTCQPTAQGFGCLPSGVQQAGDGCQQNDSCADGLLCLAQAELETCCHLNCCAPMCDATHPCERGTCEPLATPPGGGDGFGYCR